MSERVTWEVCPRCADDAAVGWAGDGGAAADPTTCRPVEFDCLAGCSVPLDLLAQAYRFLRRLP